MELNFVLPLEALPDKERDDCAIVLVEFLLSERR